MAQYMYLLRGRHGIIFNNFDYRDKSYLFNDHDICIFDVPRDSDLAQMPLTFLEDLKNGHLNSTKYVPEEKSFPPPLVVVFSNNYPIKEKLSLDRWRVYTIMLLDDNEWVMDRDESYNMIN